MKKIVLILAAPLALGPLPFTVAPAPSDPEPVVVETETDLRALTEIGGDPQKMTAEERRKTARPRQVLGMPPVRRRPPRRERRDA